jgi:hypothetical protein
MHLEQSQIQEHILEITQATSPRLHDEIDLDDPDYIQDLFENYNYDKPLIPEEFSVDRGWWFSCRTCGGRTYLRTPHPYCRHCGFSQSSL